MTETIVVGLISAKTGIKFARHSAAIDRKGAAAVRTDATLAERVQFFFELDTRLGELTALPDGYAAFIDKRD